MHLYLYCICHMTCEWPTAIMLHVCTIRVSSVDGIICQEISSTDTNLVFYVSQCIIYSVLHVLVHVHLIFVSILFIGCIILFWIKAWVLIYMYLKSLHYNNGVYFLMEQWICMFVTCFVYLLYYNIIYMKIVFHTGLIISQGGCKWPRVIFFSIITSHIYHISNKVNNYKWCCSTVGKGSILC